MSFSQKFQKERYIFVKFIGFLAVSRIEGCFHWPSSLIRSGVMADPSFLGKRVAGVGLRGFVLFGIRIYFKTNS